MKTIGFLISHKENEKRRALVPADIKNIKDKGNVYIETGYGDVLGYSDEDYRSAGVNISSRADILTKDIICDPKIGDAEYLDELRGQTIWGWIHAVQNRDITDKLINGNLTAFAWEDMYEGGRHCFWRNNEIAGEAAVLHAYMCYGVFPYNTKVAVLGRGNTAIGAVKTLNFLGANVTVYNRHTEALLREELGQYDVVVNAVLWDTRRKDHIISREDLKRMKRNSMIIDISCDRNGGVETSVPTTFDNPTYIVDGVLHYVVDHTPSLFYKTASESISREVCKYIDHLVEMSPEAVLGAAEIVRGGELVDPRIVQFQGR
jgi:N5-(carboxyethyl)ornithine synthase